MKKNMWVASPFLYVVVAFMFVMSFLSLQYSLFLFVIELGISLMLAIALAFLHFRFKFHTLGALRSAKKVLLVETQQMFHDFPVPVLVSTLNGDIVWTNKPFESELAYGDDILGENTAKYIYPKTLKQLMGEKGSNIQRRDKKYTVYALKTHSSYILYFVDDTYYKQVYKEYTEKRTVIALVSFDNKDELIRDSSGGEESYIVSEVENIIRAWAGEVGGFMKTLSNNRYMIIAEDIHIEKAKERRFDVLDRVREIKNSRDLCATVSIGIGKGASSNIEAENWARQAIDMALGRGGDQVALLKKGGTYEFFGGVSRGVERRDKVRTRVIAATLTDHIKSSSKVYLMGHKFSDLDSMGSAIGMWAVISKGLKRNAYIVVNEAQSLAMPLIDSMKAAYPTKKIFINPWEALQDLGDKSLVIVLDTHSPSFVEAPELLNTGNPIVIIDHHRMMVTHIKNSVIFYHEPYSSSASEMVSELVQYIDGNAIESVEAQALMAGIALDTKNFVLKTGARTFEASAFLRRRGADTVKVKSYFSNTLSTYRERASLVANADVYKEFAISYTDHVTTNTRVAAAQAADELLSIQGVKASFVMFEENSTINISGRSLGEVNVQVILEKFGGGGHLTMAGAQIKDSTLSQAKRALIEAIDDTIVTAYKL